jgi:hypothetical protein
MEIFSDIACVIKIYISSQLMQEFIQEVKKPPLSEAGQRRFLVFNPPKDKAKRDWL